MSVKLVCVFVWNLQQLRRFPAGPTPPSSALKFHSSCWTTDQEAETERSCTAFEVEAPETPALKFDFGAETRRDKKNQIWWDGWGRYVDTVRNRRSRWDLVKQTNKMKQGNWSQTRKHQENHQQITTSGDSIKHRDSYYFRKRFIMIIIKFQTVTSSLWWVWADTVTVQLLNNCTTVSMNLCKDLKQVSAE